MTDTPEATSPEAKPTAKGPRNGMAAAKARQRKKPTAKVGNRQARPTRSAARPATSAEKPMAAAPTAAVSAVAQPRAARTLAGISEVRHFFRTGSASIFFVGPTPVTLLGLDRWVRGLSYIAYYDCWDGAHPRVFTPAVKPYLDFGSAEEITNWLLANPEVQAHIARSADPEARPCIVTVAADEETERICAELGYDLLLSSASLRDHALSAVMGAGLGPATSTEGGEVEADAGVDRRAGYGSFAVEAVLTRRGTVVGPFMTGLTGHPELTPVAGGWCGDELRPGTLTSDLQEKATTLVRRVAALLKSHGYRGFFEVDLLVNAEAGNVYLGGLTLGVSGATALTHLSPVAYADVPLFLFHLLEFLDVEVDVDLEELHRRWVELAAVDAWSLMLVKEIDPVFEQIAVAAPTGQYGLDANGVLTFRHAALDWHQLRDENEAFFLRIYGPGHCRWQGADLGVLVTRGPVRQASGEQPGALSAHAQRMVEAIRAHYAGTSLALVS